MGQLLIRVQRDPTSLFDRAVADLSEALRLSPSNRRAAAERGAARMNLGIYRHLTNADPTTAYKEALQDFDAVLAVNPSAAEAWQMRASTRMGLALYRNEFDQPEVQEAVFSEFDTALKLNGTNTLAWQGRGTAHYNAAIGRENAGKDASGEYEAALRDWRELAKLSPAETRSLRGMVERAEKYLKKE
jgi:tetratricopeptide (TPR) repeat protein